MKKIITSLLVGVTAFAALPFSGLVKASAGEKQTVLLEEQFSQDALDESKWTVTGEDTVDLFADKETGCLFAPTNIEGHHTAIKNEIKNLDYMQFDIKFQAEKKWFALYFSSELKTELGDYAPEIFMNMAGKAELSSAQGEMTFNPKTYTLDTTEWFTIKIVKVNAVTADMYIFNRGQDISTASKSTITLRTNAYNFNQFYFAMGGEGGQQFYMDNFVVKSETVDFTERVYGESVNENIQAYGQAFELIRPDSSLTFTASEMGDGIQYNLPVGAEESVIQDLEVLKTQFKASFVNAQAGDAVAYAFAIQEGNTFADGSYACLMEKDGVSIVRYESGEATTLLEKVSVSLDEAQVQVIANKSGKISVYVNGEMVGSCMVETEKYYVGSFGFFAANNNDGIIYVDTVRSLSKSYKVPVTKSVSHNFSNDYFGNEGYEDFVWNAHNGSNGIYVQDGKLVFDNVADDAYFGSAHEYDNFILDYKLCSIKVGENATASNKWLGLDIGRSISGKTQYGTHFMLAYEITPTASGVNLWSYTHGTSELKQEDINKQIVQHKRIPKEYFDAIQYDNTTKTESDIRETDAICVRYVAENGTIRMYLKRAFEAEYELYATVSGVETTGYVSLNCTGWTTLKLDDFSVSNISGVYVNADTFAPETIIKENKVVIYEQSVTNDPLAFEEVKANMDSGCASVASVGLCVLPLLAGVALVKKNRKDEDQ